jgi:hypothetical protein
MNKAKAKRKRRANQRDLSIETFLASFDLNALALPEQRLRQLVLDIILRHEIEPFVRRMVKIIDSLKAGHTGQAAQFARRSKDPSFVELTASISRAAKDGRIGVARTTAILAAGYAHQNSLDYLCQLLAYFDRFRDKAFTSLQ